LGAAWPQNMKLKKKKCIASSIFLASCRGNSVYNMAIFLDFSFQFEKQISISQKFQGKKKKNIASNKCTPPLPLLIFSSLLFSSAYK